MKKFAFTIADRRSSRFSNLGYSLAFTMAEILISLTIIGIIAAITLPALQGNINEKTWDTKRKALHSRLSQAIGLLPALNGYGIGANNNETIQNASMAFVTEGLSKVLKINNICDNSHLSDCGLPNKITTLDDSTIDLPTKMTDLNSSMGYGNLVLNTLATGIETANGENILVFYNPNCTGKDVLIPDENVAGEPGFLIKQHICANFVFDLNGSKGPNKLGKDIGYITALYSYDSSVVSGIPVKNVGSQKNTDAISKCRAVDENYTVPNLEEGIAIYYNNNLNGERLSFWTSTADGATNAWMIGFSMGAKYSYAKTRGQVVLCIKR